jgi:hypothetical protein
LRRDCLDRLPDLAEAADVHLKRERLASKRLNPGGYTGILFDIAQTERDIRAGLGKRESNSAAEAASRSGYQRGLTVKAE